MKIKPKGIQNFNELITFVNHASVIYKHYLIIFGGILRKYSIDELPQFISVFLGSMSIVGPRPPLQTEYVNFTDFQKQKLSVKPGITCLWQVQGRNNINDANEWIEKDLEYISKRDFIFGLINFVIQFIKFYF